MSFTLTFVNQHACLIPDTLDQLTNNASASHDSAFDPINALSVFDNDDVLNPDDYNPNLLSPSVANNPPILFLLTM